MKEKIEHNEDRYSHENIKNLVFLAVNRLQHGESDHTVLSEIQESVC